MKKQQFLVGCLLVALAGLAWLVLGQQDSRSSPIFKSEAEARTFLKAEVATGNISELEARVRLAEAISQVKKQDRRQNWRKEYANSIQELMEKEGIGEDEAKAEFKASMKTKKKPSPSKAGQRRNGKDKVESKTGK